MLKNKALTERTTLLEENFLSTGSFFRKINKCIEVRGMFDEEEAKKGFYYRGL
jgi:hypothetical protein